MCICIFFQVEGADAESVADTHQDFEDTQDSIATRYVDECLLRAVTLTNEQKGDYKQVRIQTRN